jgi:organic radical activating enzyme
MSKIKVSEIFYSLQGEGKYVGVPSVFLRTFGCNFSCSGFGMPKGEVSTERDAVDAKAFDKFENLPLVHTGCDSYASWDPRFKDLSPMLEKDAIIDALLSKTPNGRWFQHTGNPVHLVITGGEPLLGWQRSYKDLLEDPRMEDLDNITFETNGTQPLSKEFFEYIMEWHGDIRGIRNGEYDVNKYLGRFREMTFSVSPKLSGSGEKWEDAIKPEIVEDYQKIGQVYLKFVVSTKEDIFEAQQAVDAYRNGGFMGSVYLMPTGGTTEGYNANKINVAEEALKLGWNYSPRLHVDLWGNGWGK